MERDDKELKNQMQSHFSDFEFEVPGNDLWPEIESRLISKRRRKFLGFYITGAAAIFLAGLFCGWLFFNNHQDSGLLDENITLNETSNIFPVASRNGVNNDSKQQAKESTLKNIEVINSKTDATTPLESSRAASNTSRPDETRLNMGIQEDITYVSSDHEIAISSQNSQEKNQGSSDTLESEGIPQESLLATNSSPNSDNYNRQIPSGNNIPENTEPKENNLSAVLTNTQYHSDLLPDSSDSNPALSAPDKQSNANQADSETKKRGNWRLLASGGIGNFTSIHKNTGYYPRSSGFSFSLGGMSKDVAVDSDSSKGLIADPADFDQLQYSIPVDINLLVQKSLSKRWSAETGVSMNIVRSEYSVNGSTFRPRLTYLTIPVGASYRVINGKNTQLELFSQARFGKIISSVYLSQQNETTQAAYDQTFRSNPPHSGINSCIALGIGGNQRISDRLSVNLRTAVSMFYAPDQQQEYVRTIQSLWPEAHAGLMYVL